MLRLLPTFVHIIDNDAIRRHSAVRFRSEYDYAVFEYWRSAKLLQWLRRAGIDRLGHVLDDGCGGGGMCVSLAEETIRVTGIDLDARFGGAGEALAAEKGIHNLGFAQADGAALPFADDTFDVILSHSVIEHVAQPQAYLHEARRTLRPGGVMFLQTAPYLSPSGSHLPRLRVPVPLHLLIGRRAAFALSRWIACHRPQWLDAPVEGSSFLTTAKRGEKKLDDLRYRVTVRNLRQYIANAGFRVVREDPHVAGVVRRSLPNVLVRGVRQMPMARDIVITNMEYLLAA